MAEIAAAARDDFLQALGAAEAKRDRATTLVDLADRDALSSLSLLYGADTPPPWQLGETLAERARHLWHIGEGPLTSRRLAEIAAVPVDFLTQDPGETIDTCMDGIGYRKPRDGTGFRAMIRSPYPSNRRFHFARLLASEQRLRPAQRGDALRRQRGRRHDPANLGLKELDRQALAPETHAMTTREQYVVDEAGRPTAVLVPLDEWEQIQEALEELGAIRAYDEAKRQHSDPVPFEQAMAEIDGDAGI